MKKICISLSALLAIFLTACTEDFTVPNNLTVNNPESALTASDVTVTPAGATSIVIADYINEDGTDKQQLPVAKIQVAQGKMPANSSLNPRVFMSTSSDFTGATTPVYEITKATITNEGEVNISPSALSQLYTDKISRKPDDATLYLATRVEVITNKTTIATIGDEGGKYFPLNVITYTPDVVKLEDAYYYIGNLTTEKKYQFTNASGQSFYDDPVISCVIPSSGGWHWFRLAGESSFNADGTINWDLENANKTSICPEIKDDEGKEGVCIVGTQSWHLIESDAYIAYRVTIDLINMTYKIKGIIDAPEYYGVGTMTNWNADERVSAMFPTNKKTVTLTTYFTGAWDMRMWPAENFGNWGLGKAIGITENGGNAASGSLVWNTENDGNLASPEAGYYTLDCDYKNMTYQWTKYGDQAPATYEKIGLVGANDDWSNDIFLTQVTNTSGSEHPTHLWYALGVKIDYCSWGVQFRANGEWIKQWGKGDQGFPYGQSNTTSNIEGIEPGTYNIYFNDITGHYYFIAQ